MSTRSEVLVRSCARGRPRGRVRARGATRGQNQHRGADNVPVIPEDPAMESITSVLPTTADVDEHQPAPVNPRHGEPEEYRSAASASSTIIRKRRMELRAAEERAKIRKIAIRETLDLETELIDKRLALELAEIEEGENDRYSSYAASRHHDENRVDQDIHEWMTRSEAEPSILPEYEHTNIPRATSTPMEPTVVRQGEIEQLTQALTHTINAVRESVRPATSTDQLITRLTSTKELATFDGDGLEWIRFKRTFMESSTRGGYSDEENVTRLCNCLRGEAREAVASLMLTANNTEQIFEILELRFGNPDTTLRKIVEEVKQLPRIAGSGIVVFATKVRNCVEAMRALNHTGYLHSPELVSDIIGKMPKPMISHYNRFIHENGNQEPRLVSLSRFLFFEAEVACKAGTNDMLAPKRTSQKRDNNIGSKGTRNQPAQQQRVSVCSTTDAETSPRRENKRTRGKRSNKETDSNGCAYCRNKRHQIADCDRFTSQSVSQRWEWAKRKGICFKCLVDTHKRTRCKERECGQDGCRRPHHALLHSSEKNKAVSTNLNPEVGPTTSSDKTTNAVTMNTWDGKCKRVLLKIIPVILQGDLGCVSTYALLDEGSTISLLDQEVAIKIGADGPSDRLVLHGARNMNTADAHSKRVSLDIISKHDKLAHRINNVRTVKGLSLPQQSLHHEDMIGHAHIKDLRISYYTDAFPTILLGQDNWHLIVSLELRSASRNAPVASRTALGWTIHGYASPALRQRSRCINLQLWHAGKQNATAKQSTSEEEEQQEEEQEEKNLHQMVKANFELESIGLTKRDRTSILIKRAEELLVATTRRVEDRWETGLLWRDNIVEFPNNRDSALNRLKAIERKLDRDPSYGRAYCQQMENLIENGYARKVTEPTFPKRTPWFLPHFAVTNRNKPGKLRLVFDAAAKTNGLCLNDRLLPGPDYLNSLLGVLMRFRQKPVAFVGDIKEMFLQIKIRPDDRHAQHFLWRGMDRQGEPDAYVMTSMIFGAASSPCSAQYVKNRNAEEFAAEYPQAAKAILRKHYVDDYLDSVDNEEEAIKLIQEVTEIHRRGGFGIRGWASNCRKVLDGLPESGEPTQSISLTLQEEHSTEKTLGLKWYPQADTFSFDMNKKRVPVNVINGTRKPTKREMLRVIMSVFDPHGFLAPFTIRSKILLQNVWRSGIKWDQQLREQEYKDWRVWLDELESLKFCHIPRCYIQHTRTPNNFELHIFCDASEQASATVAYWRIQYDDGTIELSFIASKSRVAPLKPMSIPRLELQAALLGSRLAQYIIEEHETRATERIYWTDSKTVLCWLRSDPRTYKAFVAHRLSEIDELTDVAEWRWVPTRDNPADEATRSTGTIPTGEARWIKGPSFLYKPKEQWPQEPDTGLAYQTHDEHRGERTQFCAFQFETLELSLPAIERFSSWKRLIRSTAWMLLFIERCRKQQVSSLTSEHISRAEALWIRKSQSESFTAEMRTLQKTQTVENDSRLRHLTPYIDNAGILRLRSRINNTQGVEDDVKSPVILDGKHPYTKLLVLYHHQQAGHGSTEVVINELRQRYWIVKLRPTVRSVAHHCQMCRKQRAKPKPPRMGDLPEARLAHHRRPFTYCGLDYFGPMEVTIGRHREKRWGVLFTCLTTRAVHLELAGSLNADSAIMALRRMAARRGYPSEIYSDNGTNFRGADAELKRAIKEINVDKQKAAAAHYGIMWRFIPPAAPHMGGSWERLVRSVKQALKATLKERAPREETLLTLLTEAEHTVNTRPLTHVSIDHRDPESLTPNHFLIGASSGVAIAGKFSDDDLLLRRQWRIAQRLADLFWSRWLREYLPTLSTRKIWTKEADPLSPGDVVLIVDHSLPRNVWPMGIITATFPGRDGRIRVVDVRTQGGILRRPATKIVVIPTDP